MPRLDYFPHLPLWLAARWAPTDWSKAVVQKTACYLSLCLLAAPLVALAAELPPGSASPMQTALTQLAVACPALAPRLNSPDQQLLQGFYRESPTAHRAG